MCVRPDPPLMDGRAGPLCWGDNGKSTGRPALQALLRPLNEPRDGVSHALHRRSLETEDYLLV